MSTQFDNMVKRIAAVDLFKRDKVTGQWLTGIFVGRPFAIDYDRAHVLVADAWKQKAKGIPQGAFLLAYYEDEANVQEAVLLRVLKPAKLPTDNDMISSMVESYKDNLQTSGDQSQLDTFTRYEFSFSGIECRILGTFYKDESDKILFGADLENFYSAHHYGVVKPNATTLEYIVNAREDGVTGKQTDMKLGTVRYSSSQRFQLQEEKVSVFVRPQDFLGKRTALFGMTRTGKSNSVKKLIQASELMSRLAPHTLSDANANIIEENLDPFVGDVPKYPVGQIIFDVNGEYANPNLQDAGTAIFEMFQSQVTRYSVLNKSGFKVMKINFYRDIESGFDLARAHLEQVSGNYIENFVAADMEKPADYDTNFSARTRYDRKCAAYQCCLYQAGFPLPEGHKVQFQGEGTINTSVRSGSAIDPSRSITFDEASIWFSWVWDNYNSDPFFINYRSTNGRDWADEDLKAMLVFLTRKRAPGGSANVSGYQKLRKLIELHTATVGKSFEDEVIGELRDGRIIIIDLSQGDPDIQGLYSERICRRIFADSLDRFVANLPNNFVQFYFEEAHNLFPKQQDKDLTQIYNRLAKEGAKLNLGLIYATQEASAISANILKNTQNWFVSHLNNEDETNEVRKYYDYADFVQSLMRFSAATDRGFVRVKTYSSPFIVPVQVDRFAASIGDSIRSIGQEIG